MQIPGPRIPRVTRQRWRRRVARGFVCTERPAPPPAPGGGAGAPVPRSGGPRSRMSPRSRLARPGRARAGTAIVCGSPESPSVPCNSAPRTASWGANRVPEPRRRLSITQFLAPAPELRVCTWPRRASAAYLSWLAAAMARESSSGSRAAGRAGGVATPGSRVAARPAPRRPGTEEAATHPAKASPGGASVACIGGTCSLVVGNGFAQQAPAGAGRRRPAR